MSHPGRYGAVGPAGRRARRPLPAALILGALSAAALSYVGLVDPHEPDTLFPVCPFRLLTGWNCPGCGALRMIHDVLHGELAAAVADNVVLLVGIPLVAGWSLLRHRRRASPLTIPAAVVIASTLVVWGVVRNLPGFPLVPTLLTN